MKTFRLMLLAVVLVAVVCTGSYAAVAYSIYNGVQIGSNGIKVGTRSNSYNRFQVNGSTGATSVLGNLSVNSDKFTVAASSGNTTVAGTLVVTGAVSLNGGLALDTNKFTVADSTGNTSIGGTLAVTGAVTAPVLATIVETTGSRTLTVATDGGKTILCSYAGAVAITLPANGAAAGTWMRVINIGTDDTAITVSAAAEDTLIAPNDAQADSVTFASGQRIGASVLFISTGTYWVVINENAGCAMTVNT